MRTLAAAIPTLAGPPWFNTLDFVLRPENFVARHSVTHGRYYGASMVGGAKVVFTAEPEHIRRIFSADEETFRNYAPLSLRSLFGPRSVLLTSGLVHARQRRLLAPPLTGSRLRSFGAQMHSIAQMHVGALRPGQHIRALDLATDFTLDVIVRTVFGIGNTDKARELKQLVMAFVNAVPRVPLYLPLLQQTWFPPWTTFVRLRKSFNDFVLRQIAARHGEAAPREDVLSLLLQVRTEAGSPIPDDEVCDQLVTLLLAGHETTAITLAMSLERLHRNPELLATLRAELQASSLDPDEVQKLPFLSAVVDETLRIDPVVPDVGRVPTRDFELAPNILVTPEHLLLVLIEALHKDATIYPEPLVFRPARFLQRKPAAHEYAPFGGGVRRCLGAAFSDYETKIFLANLLSRTELSLVRPTPEPRTRRNITLGPKYGVPLKVLRRD